MPDSWKIIERGVFALAACSACGWESPARRAFATARREGEAHLAVCAGAPAGASAPGPTDAPAVTDEDLPAGRPT